MRKIEREMIEAIKAKKPYSNDNTRVSISSSSEGNLIKVELHGHTIAEIWDKSIRLSDCGYQTKTTKSRLNCLLNHFNLPIIYSKNYQWYIGINVWEGSTSYLIAQDNTPKPTGYDAVLGSRNIQQPRPYDAVLGGKH